MSDERASVMQKGESNLLQWLSKLVEQRNQVFGSIKKLIPEQQYLTAMSRLLLLADLGVMVLQLTTVGIQDYDTRFHSVYTMTEQDMKKIAEKVENIIMSARMVFDNVHTMTVINSVRTNLAATLNGETLVNLSELERYTNILSSIKIDNTLSLPDAVELYEIDSKSSDFMDSLTDKRIPQNLRDLSDSVYSLEAALNANTMGVLSERVSEGRLKFIIYHACNGDMDFVRFVQQCYAAKVMNTVPNTTVYRINYGHMLSKWRGETEKRFQNAMNWFTQKAAANHVSNQGFDILVFENIEALMGRRSGGDDPEHLVTIKNSMLQIMDNFNKNNSLSRYGLIFTSGTTPENMDSAFMRRITTVLISEPLSAPEMDTVKLESIRYLLDTNRLNVIGLDTEPIVSLRRAHTQGQLERMASDLYITFTVSLVRGMYLLEGAPNILNSLQRYYNLLGEPVESVSGLSVAVGEGSPYISGTNSKSRKVRYHEPQDPINLTLAKAKKTVFISEGRLV